MIDAKKLLDQFLGANGGGAGRGILDSVQQRAGASPLASGALAGGLASFLLGSKAGRKLTKNAVTYGGMALVAGLAYKAYSDYQARQSGSALPQPDRRENLPPPPQDGVFMPSGSEADSRARLLVSAMIAAAKADGYIDAGEQKQIFDRLGAADLDSESKAYLMDQLAAPLDLDSLVRQAERPEVATEVYAASLLAIDPDHPAEKAYLQMLAARLNLDAALVADIHDLAEQAREDR